MHSNDTQKPFSWLSKMIVVPGDGNCFFHAIARELNRRGLESSITHTELRARGIAYLRNRPDILAEFPPENETAEQYLQRMSRVDTWAIGPIIDAVSAEFNISLQIMEHRNNQDMGFMNINNVPNVRANIGLIRLNQNHFNILNIEENLVLKSKTIPPAPSKENPAILPSTQNTTPPIQTTPIKTETLKNNSPKPKKEIKPIVKHQTPLVLSKKTKPKKTLLTPELCVFSQQLENEKISLIWDISKTASKSGLTVLALGFSLVGVTTILEEFAAITFLQLALTPVLGISLLTALIISIPGAMITRDFETSLRSAKLHIQKKDYTHASLILDQEANRWIAAPFRFFFLTKEHYALSNTLKTICLDNKPEPYNTFEPSFTNQQKVQLIKLKCQEESNKLVKIMIERELEEEIATGSKEIINNCGKMSLRDIDAMLTSFFNRLIRIQLNHPKVKVEAKLTKLIEFIHAFKNQSTYQFDQNNLAISPISSLRPHQK